MRQSRCCSWCCCHSPRRTGRSWQCCRVREETITSEHCHQCLRNDGMHWANARRCVYHAYNLEVVLLERSQAVLSSNTLSVCGVVSSNVPLGAIVLLLLFFFLRIKDTDNRTRKLPLEIKLGHMDPLGCIVFIAAICCLRVALQLEGQSQPWKSATVVGLMIGFGLLILLFFRIQAKLREKASIPLRVLRTRSIVAGSGTLFFPGATISVVGDIVRCLQSNRYRLQKHLGLLLHILLVPSSGRRRRYDW